tara:strand:+ start:9320 stop:9706 length:387 start_codon:yes stop_codon:yes gene_type:complete
MTYKPLPEGLTIRESSVDGLGLFAARSFPAETILGISHIRNKRFEDSYIRTPLGGFINHSESPNVEKVGPAESREVSEDMLLIRTIRDIAVGEELLVKYTLYDMDEEAPDEDIWGEYKIRYDRNEQPR